MDHQKEVMNQIKEINKLFDWFCDKIKHEHHKEKDGIWVLWIDRWTEEIRIRHDGYWLDAIDVCVSEKELLKGLDDFKTKVKKRMDEEIERYDFIKHCAKE